jgi:tripeptidyl-peptidase-1
LYENTDTYDQPDLDVFFSKYYSAIPNGTHPVLQSVDGGSAPASVKNETLVQGESLLDMMISYPIIYPQQIRLFQTGDLVEQTELENSVSQIDLFLDAVDAVSECLRSIIHVLIL